MTDYDQCAYCGKCDILRYTPEIVDYCLICNYAFEKIRWRKGGENGC